MEIKESTVAGIHYTLKDQNGQQLDSSEGKDPLFYLHGVGQLVPGMEEALTGKKVGEKFNIVVPPPKGYGEPRPELVQQIPTSQFGGVENVEAGMQFQAQTDGGPVMVTVTEVKDETATVDANHPLAGITLHFDVEVVDVREATADELSHGHAHGPGGVQH